MLLSKAMLVAALACPAFSNPIAPFVAVSSSNTTVLTARINQCTAYYTPSPGEICISVAERFGIDAATFMSWNPTIDKACSNMWAGSAYCVAVENTSSKTPTSAITPTNTVSLYPSAPTTSQAAGRSHRRCGSKVYTTYTGDGSKSDGWPAVPKWISFDCMFKLNKPLMRSSCAQWGVARDSAAEIASIRNAIKKVARLSGIDKRFILAVMMQESQGCVRVITTRSSHFNPGLMQSHNGSATCNSNLESFKIPGTTADRAYVRRSCPCSEIEQMILEGTMGTSSGDGLMQLMQKQGNSDSSRWYRTARMYNGGSIQNPRNLNEGCCTPSYASDIANRLTGWTNA